MKGVCCYNCRFFSLGEHGSPAYESENLSKEFEDDWEGICKFNPPVLGELMRDREGDDFRHYGEWPKIMAGEWCGKFELRYELVEKASCGCQVCGRPEIIAPQKTPQLAVD